MIKTTVTKKLKLYCQSRSMGSVLTVAKRGVEQTIVRRRQIKVETTMVKAEETTTSNSKVHVIFCGKDGHKKIDYWQDDKINDK